MYLQSCSVAAALPSATTQKTLNFYDKISIRVDDSHNFRITSLKYPKYSLYLPNVT